MPVQKTVFYVEPSEGYDDFLTNPALYTQVTEAIIRPVAAEHVKPQSFYPGESRY